MIKKYFNEINKYKAKYGKKVILLWQCGGFYEVYGLKNKEGIIDVSNIEDFGSICDYLVKEKKTSSTKGKKSQTFKYNNKHYAVVMSGMPIHGPVESKIGKLTENGYTVALWQQDKKIKDIREEFGIYSPGTNFTVNESLTNNTMCIYLEAFKKTFLSKNPRIHCGLSIVDIISGKTIYYEYNTTYLNESINYDEIERFYSIYNPSEIIIIHNFEDMTKLSNMLTFSTINCDSKHILKMGDKECMFYDEIENCKKQTYQLSILKNYFKQINSDVFFDTFAEKVYGTSSLCFLLNFMYQHQKKLVYSLNVPIYDNNENNLKLANHSLKQLNIINTGDSNKKYNSVLSFLNECKTSMGKREFANQLLHPITNEEILNNEYNIVDHIIKKKDKYFDSVKLLRKINDIDRFFRKIILEIATPYDIYNFVCDLNNISKIFDLMKKDKKMMDYFGTKLNQEVNVKNCISKMVKDIKSKIQIQKCGEVGTRMMDNNIFQNGIYVEVDEAVDNFAKRNKEMESILGFLNKTLQKTEKKNIKGIKMIYFEKSYPYIEATNRRTEIIKTHLKNKDKVNLEYKYNNKDGNINFKLNELQYIDSKKNNKKLISKQLNEAYESIFNGKEKIRKCVRNAYIHYSNSLLEYSKEIEYISNFIKIFDVIVNKAQIAVKYNYSKPEIVDSEKSFYNVEKLRHVLIEHIQQNEIYVPNSLEMGKTQNGILLYGTNAVGKSSLIKSIGICIIMAQAGMFVPCSKLTYKPYKSIYTRILGNDDIFKGLSSFAVEMSELKSILNCDKNSLILGDELCRGTEFQSALRIFISGLAWLNKITCSYIFATHFHEITDLDIIKNMKKLKLKHLTVEYNKSLGCLVYDRKLKDGPGSNNYGLTVCKSLGLPEEFINYATNVELNINLRKNNILKKKKSKYNKNLVKGVCEMCSAEGVEVHHQYPQKLANEKNIIETEDLVFNKNHNANLMNICKECHNKITKNETVHIKKKTMDGYRTLEI